MNAKQKTILDGEIADVAKSLDSVQSVEELNDLEKLENKKDKRPEVLQAIAARRLELSTGNDPVMRALQEQMAQMAGMLEKQAEQQAQSQAVIEQMQSDNEKLALDNQSLRNKVIGLEGGVVMTAEAVLLKDLDPKEMTWLDPEKEYKKGDVLYKYLGDEYAHADGRGRVAMTFDPDGKGEYFAVPKNLLLWQ